jgi:hypothetical protein
LIANKIYKLCNKRPVYSKLNSEAAPANAGK